MLNKTESQEKRTNYAYDPQKIETLRRLAAAMSTTLKPVNMSMLLDEALDYILAKYAHHLNGTSTGHKRKNTAARG